MRLCSHCGHEEAAPDRKQGPRCLATQARRRERRRNPSVKDLDSAIKLLRKQGRSIIRERPKRRVFITTPYEVMLLERYAKRR